MGNQHSKCDDCYKTHLPENHDRTILPSEAFSEWYVPEFNQASEGELRTLDEILSQAFTDGSSDTMWQNDKHVEIFATAKKELETLIRTEKLKLLAEVRERVVGEDERYARVKDGIRIVGQSEKPRNELRAEQRIELNRLEAEL